MERVELTMPRNETLNVTLKLCTLFQSNSYDSEDIDFLKKKKTL